MQKTMEQYKFSMDEAILKKQYIQVCSLDEGATQEKVRSFAEISKLLGIGEDDIEEWIIEAMSNGIIDAKIDQINEKVIVKTTMLRVLNEKEWMKIKDKIAVWRQRFS